MNCPVCLVDSHSSTSLRVFSGHRSVVDWSPGSDGLRTWPTLGRCLQVIDEGGKVESTESLKEEWKLASTLSPYPTPRHRALRIFSFRLPKTPTDSFPRVFLSVSSPYAHIWAKPLSQGESFQVGAVLVGSTSNGRPFRPLDSGEGGDGRLNRTVTASRPFSSSLCLVLWSPTCRPSGRHDAPARHPMQPNLEMVRGRFRGSLWVWGRRGHGSRLGRN